MSRIHEALKKAEQERRAGEPAPKVSATVIDAPALPSVVASVPPLVAGSAEAVAPSPAVSGHPQPALVPLGPDGAGPLSWDLLMSRCAQHEWHPDGRFLFFNKNKHDTFGMEEFRTLRSRLYQIREKRPLKIVLVGSALPGEGKTFVSGNLAQVLVRQHGRRAVLIDADLRRPMLHNALGAPGEPGLLDYLGGNADETAILQRGPIENLFFIPGGKPASNPAELLANGRLKPLVQRLASVFDWIVIDSPPAVLVSDAVQTASCCDGVLLVIKAGSTSFELAQKARHEFRHSPLLGIVLNRVAARSTYHSYYYNSYGKAGTKQ